MEELWLDARVQFEPIQWSDVKPGETIYHYVKRFKDRRAYGPFTVVDPVVGRVKNLQDVEFDLPKVELLRMIK